MANSAPLSSTNDTTNPTTTPLRTPTLPLQPLIHHGDGGPNPTKTLLLLQLLSLPRTTNPIPLTAVKSPTYTAINPNGRLPALFDPNTGLTLWESGAIITYLVSVYDKENRWSFEEGTAEAWHAQQWLYYQTTGQGPYYGQAFWFARLHEEKLPSAVGRYVKEMERVMGVVEGWLGSREAGKDDGKWLVGGRVSYADLAWLPYQLGVRYYFGGSERDGGAWVNEGKYPEVRGWVDRMLALEGVRGVLEACEPFGAMLRGEA